MIFFLPLFCRKISLSISRHSAKKNLLENIRIVSSSLWRKQNEILSSTKPWKFFIWPVLDNHCWPRFDSQDWFSGSPTDFSSGCVCWTRDQKILSRELKNSRIFWIFREKRTTNIGKSWSNKYYAKISGQIQTLFERVNFEKKNIDQNIFLKSIQKIKSKL